MTDQETSEQSEYVEYNRVLWHSRRGMLELDLVLEPFVRECYRDLDEADQARYRQLLTMEDQQLFDWFLKKGRPVNSDLEKIVALILDYQKQRKF